MRIVVWCMGLMNYQKMHGRAWEYLIDELDPDIALLQETVPPDDLEQSGQVSWTPVKRLTWGSAIYSKDGGIESIDLGSYRYRGWAKAGKVTIPGKDLYLVSTHVPIIDGWAYPYIKEIFDLIRPELEGKQFVVGGDLNSCRMIDSIQGTKFHTEFFDEIESNGFYNCVSAYYNSEPMTYFGRKAKKPYQDDHVFIDEGSRDLLRSCEVTAFEEPVSTYSDHVPIVVELEV